jgi:hypothetical protein
MPLAEGKELVKNKGRGRDAEVENIGGVEFDIG